MNWYKRANKKYTYETNCVDAKGEDIEKMVDLSTEITWDEFKKNVSIDEIKYLFGGVYDYGGGSGLKIQNDYAVSFHKSKYRGKPCYYIDHSSIEYIFC
jgi:hypothetical protein